MMENKHKSFTNIAIPIFSYIKVVDDDIFDHDFMKFVKIRAYCTELELRHIFIAYEI